MTAAELRQKFLDFFKGKGHAVIPSASLIPENDPTVLFTTAGMHPLVPFLLGEKHPMGNRLANVQKCLRTDDIEEVGDNRHLTFFEMLGNWSLGDYFKREQIAWSFEFLISKDWVGIDPKRFHVTVFEGDADAPRDEESIEVWQAQFEMAGIGAEMGVAGKDEPSTGDVGPRIYAYPKNKNWWGPAGQTGPCGPDTEIFFDTKRKHDPAYGPVCHPNCDCGRFVEIWNDVFMEYEKVPRAESREPSRGEPMYSPEYEFVPLKQKNVDTGMGLERIAAVVQGKDTIFETELFQPLFDELSAVSSKQKTESFRIIADHVRAAVFVIGDQRGIAPSNVGQGYIVRRLLRRAVREGRKLGIMEPFLAKLALVVIGEFGSAYPELEVNRARITEEIGKEEEKFRNTLEKGMKELEKMAAQGALTGEQAFILFSTYGFPWELTEEIMREKGIEVDRAAFEAEFRKHQELSRSASAGAFKGGLADHSAETTRLHTATHLLHQALRQVLGGHVRQKGSNITAERLRFDFSHPEKMTPEQIKQVEEIVNGAIGMDLPVRYEEMSVDEAKNRGAIGLFETKYGEKVKVYFVGQKGEESSKEICGGPHVAMTGEIGRFKILKEEAVSAGVRRIKASVDGN